MALHCVYYCYNADNEMLYIGCTKQILHRLSQHKSKSAWVRDLHNVRLRWFDSFWDARRFEEKAILRNRPEYNRHVARTINGKTFWVSPEREIPTLDDDCLKRFKSIRASLKGRYAARLARRHGIKVGSSK